METTKNTAARLTLFACLALSLSVHAQETSTPPVSRKNLLSAFITPRQSLEKIEIKEVILPPKLQAPLHLHPCPVVGVVQEGGIIFQVAGGPVQRLKAGDAFYEPANVRIARFDNEGAIPAKFVAVYLLDSNGQELIRLLPQ